MASPPAEYSPALLYYFINKTAYSGMIRHNARGEYNVLYGRYRHFWSDGVTLAHSQLLQRAHVLQGDYRQVFDLLETEDFVFLDPPYDCQFTDYGNTEYRDGFGEDKQMRLA
ncbi:MAG: DNA adenine methylase, partial [Bacteroidia bacterium]|nr:DNA adenine methylase [Bacteroidia bacterium]